jgi:hypothetical protein
MCGEYSTRHVSEKAPKFCRITCSNPYRRSADTAIRQNNREEQRKIIRYNHLVANLVVFHNVVSITRVLQELVYARYVVTPEIITRLSPYKTEHINRFGHYELRFDHVPPPVTEELRLSSTSPEVGVIC